MVTVVIHPCASQDDSQISSRGRVLPTPVVEEIRAEESQLGLRSGEAFGYRQLVEEEKVYVLVNPALNDPAELALRLDAWAGQDLGTSSGSSLPKELVKRLIEQDELRNTVLAAAIADTGQEFAKLFFGLQVVTRSSLSALVEDSRKNKDRLIIFCYDAECSGKPGEKAYLQLRLTLRIFKLAIRVSEDPSTRQSTYHFISAQCLFRDQAVGNVKIVPTEDIGLTIRRAAIDALNGKIALSLWANERMREKWVGDQKVGLTSPSIRLPAPSQGVKKVQR